VRAANLSERSKQTGPRTQKVRGLSFFWPGNVSSPSSIEEDHVSKDQSKQGREEASQCAVDQCIAELAELVAAGCSKPVASSYVREEFEALVDEIRARADEGERAPRQSTTRLKAVPGAAEAGSFEFKSDPRPDADDGRAVETSARARVTSLDDARRVLDAIRSEESSGGGPREDLQRAIA
jgi:hypothetical protein